MSYLKIKRSPFSLTMCAPNPLTASEIRKNGFLFFHTKLSDEIEYTACLRSLRLPDKQWQRRHQWPLQDWSCFEKLGPNRPCSKQSFGSQVFNSARIFVKIESARTLFLAVFFFCCNINQKVIFQQRDIWQFHDFWMSFISISKPEMSL